MNLRTARILHPAVALAAGISLAGPASAALIAQYTFSETSGTSTADSSGNGFAGTLRQTAAGLPNEYPAAPTTASATLNATGRAGSGLQITSLDGIVTTGINASTASTLYGGSSRTIAAWINANAETGSFNQYVIAEYGNDANGERFTLRLDAASGVFRIEVAGGATVDNRAMATDLRDGNWHHVAVVFDNTIGTTIGDVQLYVDGSIVTNSANTRAINTIENSNANDFTGLTIGNSFWSPNRGFNGLIDEINIFDDAQSASQIAALAAIPEPTSGLLGIAGALLLLRRRR